MILKDAFVRDSEISIFSFPVFKTSSSIESFGTSFPKFDAAYRDLDVVQSIEFSKKQILAQAVIKKSLKNIDQASDVEIKKYYDEHPEFFESRNLFDVQIYMVKSPLSKEMVSKLDGSKNINDTNKILKSENVINQSITRTLSPETLNTELNDKLSKMNSGDILILNENNGTVLFQLLDKHISPLKYDDVKYNIKNVLTNEKIGNSIKGIVENIKKEEKIEILANFDDENKLSDNAVTKGLGELK